MHHQRSNTDIAALAQNILIVAYVICMLAVGIYLLLLRLIIRLTGKKSLWRFVPLWSTVSIKPLTTREDYISERQEYRSTNYRARQGAYIDRPTYYRYKRIAKKYGWPYIQQFETIAEQNNPNPGIYTMCSLQLAKIWSTGLVMLSQTWLGRRLSLMRLVPSAFLIPPIHRTNRQTYELERRIYRSNGYIQEYGIELNKPLYGMTKAIAQKYDWPYIKEHYDND